MKPKNFAGDLLMIGYGAVGRCTLPLIYKHIAMPSGNITVLDFADVEEDARYVGEHGSRFEKGKVEKDNLDAMLSRHVKPGGIIIDLAWNIGCIDIVTWCHEHDVRYVNTSVELWDPEENENNPRPTARTLYARHMELRQVMGDWDDTGGWKGGPTAILDHGANPGWVQHCTKQALEDIAERLLTEPRAPVRLAKALAAARKKRQWGRLARALGVKTIHISERDTQRTRKPKRPDEFVNTWSVEGFREEGTAPAEMGWGTHERILPEGAHFHKNGPRNQNSLDSFGMNTWVRSLVPKGSSKPGEADFQEIVGMVVRHGEAFSISEYLTVRDHKAAVAYRPTVHYAYLPCDAAVASLQELRGRNYEIQENQRLMYDDIIAGRDIMGCLLMGHKYQSWWIGSLLSIEETRRLVPDYKDVNPTTLQVAASVVAAVRWMLDNPREGVKLPDHLPHDQVLPEIREYLGTFISEPVNWTPLDNWDERAAGQPKPSRKDAWQFVTFQARGQI
jgi:homospermidine synthase